MAVAGTRESWDNGGLTFGQPNVGGSAEQEEEVWDDRAILKAFDDALNTHTRKPVDEVEARKWNKHAAQELAAQPSTPGSSRVPPSLTPAAATAAAAAAAATPRGTTGSGSNTAAGLPSASPTAASASTGYQQQQGQGQTQGFQAADRRFASLLAKGGAGASRGGGGEARALPAGIPGPWEPVAGPREGRQYSREDPPDERGQRFEYARPGPSEVYPRGDEYSNGSHTYPTRAAPQYPPPAPPLGGIAASYEDGGLGRHGLPPPPPPPPHPGMGPHAAAFQSLDGVPDDDLADLLLAWYYSGYYTGRYRAMQEARKQRNGYRRQYPPPPSAGGHHGNHHGAPPTPSSAYQGGGGGVGGGEGWGGDPSGGWHGQQQQHRPPSLSVPPGAPAGPPPSVRSSPGGAPGRGSFSRRGP